MPQGKMKVKARLPTGAKGKKGISKPKDVQKKNRPAQEKRDLLKKAVTKAINDSNETTFVQKGISKPKDVQKKNRPAQEKRDLLKKAVTKAINDSNETTFVQKAAVQGKKFHIVPADDIKPGSSSKKDSNLDKGRLPKKK